MGWLQLHTDIGNQEPEGIETLLYELGAVSISLKDAGDHPLLEPLPGETPVWPTISLTALFPEEAEERVIKSEIDAQHPELKLSFSRLEEQDWQANFEAELTPRQFGERLWIVPDRTQARRRAVNATTDPTSDPTN